MPTIHESAEELQQVLKQTRHPLARQRVHALFLLASGQATSSAQVGALLSVNRETVGDWLRLYADGGLEALRTIRAPPGATSRLTPAARADLERALHDPEGFPSYAAIRDWLWQQHGIWYDTGSLGNLCRATWGTRSKVARPCPQKNARCDPAVPGDAGCAVGGGGTAGERSSGAGVRAG
jgi:transposase